MLNSLLTVLWYNGYEDCIKAIYYYIRDCKNESYIPFPNHEKNILSYDFDKPDRILWSVLVMKYGDYGTSPRCGWIDVENKDTILEQFKEWMIDKDMLEDEDV